MKTPTKGWIFSSFLKTLVLPQPSFATSNTKGTFPQVWPTNHEKWLTTAQLARTSRSTGSFLASFFRRRFPFWASRTNMHLAVPVTIPRGKNVGAQIPDPKTVPLKPNPNLPCCCSPLLLCNLNNHGILFSLLIWVSWMMTFWKFSDEKKYLCQYHHRGRDLYRLYQVIQCVTFLSPNLGPVTNNLWRGHVNSP